MFLVLGHRTENLNLDGAPDRFSHMRIWAGYKTKTLPYRSKGDHVKCPTLGEGPLIDPLVKAPHRPMQEGIVGDLIDKCIREKLLIKLWCRI